MAPPLSAPSSFSSESSLPVCGTSSRTSKERGDRELVTLAVVDPEGNLGAALRQAASGEDLIRVGIREAGSLGSSDAWSSAEVLLLALHPHDLGGLTWASSIRSLNPHAAIVFHAAVPNGPEEAAARSLGHTQVLFGREGLSWFARHVVALALAVERRRALDRAEDVFRQAPWQAASSASSGGTAASLPAASAGRALLPPLRVAETRFREAYLRSLLAESGGRSEAARRAGVPYRTLCAMLQKLGLEPGR
jgi:hypothetical protein